MRTTSRIPIALALTVALALSLCAPRRARAEEQKTKQAVLLIDWKGPIPDAERITLLGTIAAALAPQGYTLVDERLKEETLAGDKRLAGCIATRPCRFELAERLNVDLAIEAQLTHEKAKKAWKVKMTLLPVDVRRAGAEGDRKCTGCKEPDVEPLITSLVGEIIASERKKPRAVLAVHSKPDGAAVRLDGDDLGVTDFKHKIYAGEHHLEVAYGDKKAETQFAVEEDKTAEFDAALDETPPRITRRPPIVVLPPNPNGGETPGPAPAPPPRWMKPAGFAAIGVGVVLIAAGAALIAMDGKGTCDLVPPSEECPRVYDTQNGGIGMVVAGGVLAVGGGVVTWLAHRHRERPVTLAPIVSPSSLGLSAAGRF